MLTARQKAQKFLDEERQFRLGALPTESSNPITATLSQTVAKDTQAGLRMLAQVDAQILPVAGKIFAGNEFTQLVHSLTTAATTGHRIFFSGCGATGRLSILLEASWRRFWQELKQSRPQIAAKLPDLENCAGSVMTGGDYALIRSVEGFEDYAQFGKQQMSEAGIAAGDVLVAITEGGETSSVIGTAWRALEIGARVFFVFNNPAEVLRKHVVRSREVIEEPRITKIDLATGPMAVAGSTRMQATTIELLVVGAAVEMALMNVLQKTLSPTELAEIGVIRKAVDYSALFANLLRELAQPAAVQGMAKIVAFEEDIYRKKALVTYFTDRFLLDVLTDTTERAPTFKLPPYRKCDDTISVPSWAFVKNPLFDTPTAWFQVLRRKPNGLTWNTELYRQMNAAENVQANPPKLDNEEILKFRIGREADASRCENPDSALLALFVGDEARRASNANDALWLGVKQHAPSYRRTAVASIGKYAAPALGAENFHVPCDWPGSPIDLWARLAVKLVLNTLSTATMARMGRVYGNWMICVETSNKKLIDRGTRLIADLAGMSYEDACYLLHETMEEVAPRAQRTKDAPSPVALAIERAGLKR